MSSAATERPAEGTPEIRQAATPHAQRERVRQRERQRLGVAVAAAVAVLVALLAGAVILVRLASDSTRIGSSGSIRTLTPLTAIGGLTA